MIHNIVFCKIFTQMKCSSVFKKTIEYHPNSRNEPPHKNKKHTHTLHSQCEVVYIVDLVILKSFCEILLFLCQYL